MKKRSIKFHLSPYSILRKRKTTVNNAFASAIAPNDEYDEMKLGTALRSLGQDPDDDLKCVYCDLRAETWDHLISLVKKAELRGYGHQVGNLVPCCRACNSKKGSRDWDLHLRDMLPDQSAFEAKHAAIASYRDQYASPVMLQRAAEILPIDWARYCEIKQEVLRLMAEADTIASRLRRVITIVKA